MRGVRHRNLVANAPRFGKADSPASQRRHLHCVRLWLTSRQDVGPVPPAHDWEAELRPDSPALPTAPFRCTNPLRRLHGTLSLHSDGRKLSRQSGTAHALPKKRKQPGRPRDFVRPEPAIAHESPLAGKTPAAIWRYAPHVAPDRWVQAPPANSREHGQLSFAPLIFHSTALRSRALRSRNWPTSLERPIQSDT